MISGVLQRYVSYYQGFSKPVWLISTACFFNAMGQIMGMFVSLYMHALGYSIHTIGVAIAFYGVGFFLGSYIIGYLCEKYHPKNVIIFGLLSNGIAIIFMTFSSNCFYLYTILIACGLTTSSVRPASVLLIRQLVDPVNRPRVLGLRRVGINLGWGIAAMVCGLLAAYNYTWIFIFSGAISCLAAIYLLRNRTYQQIAFHKTGCDDSLSEKNPRSAIRKFWVIITVYLITMIVFTQTRSTYPIYLKTNYHASAHLFASLYFLNSALIVLIEVPLLSLLVRVKPHVLAAFGSFLVCVGFGILPLSHHADFAYLSCTLWTLGEILFFPTLLNIMLNTIQINHSRYTGIYQSIYSLGVLFSPIFGTTLYTLDQGNILWLICGLFGVFTFFKVIKFLK